MLRVARAPAARFAQAAFQYAPALQVASRGLAMKVAARAPKPFTSKYFDIEELKMAGTTEQARLA